jgi:hypothetical protein
VKAFEAFCKGAVAPHSFRSLCDGYIFCDNCARFLPLIFAEGVNSRRPAGLVPGAARFRTGLTVELAVGESFQRQSRFQQSDSHRPFAGLPNGISSKSAFSELVCLLAQASKTFNCCNELGRFDGLGEMHLKSGIQSPDPIFGPGISCQCSRENLSTLLR